MDKEFDLTLSCACDYLSLPGLKLNHVSERGHCWYVSFWDKNNIQAIKKNKKNIQAIHHISILIFVNLSLADILIISCA